MLNELAELFLFKNKHLEAVVRAFSTVLDDLPADKRKETLEKIGATKELITEIESQTKVILDLKKEKDKLTEQLKEKSDELIKAQKTRKTGTITLQKKIEKINKDLNNIDTKIFTHEIKNADYLISGTTNAYLNSNSMLNSDIVLNKLGFNRHINSISDYGVASISKFSSLDGLSSSNAFMEKCEKCSLDNISVGSYRSLTTCLTCHRKLCANCFSGLGSPNYIGYSTECADCRSNKTANMLGIK